MNQYVGRAILAPNYTLRGTRFRIGSDIYVGQTDGSISRNPDPATGAGTPAGAISASLGAFAITAWTTNASPAINEWAGIQAPPTAGLSAPFLNSGVMFRTAASPLRPSSISVQGTLQDGTAFNVSADANGKFNGTRVKGTVDYEYGIVQLFFVNPAGDPALNIDLTHLGIAGLTVLPADLCRISTIRYNAVSYSYLPLDAEILGLDPVRLPTDGRVPIFNPGDFAVIGHADTIGPQTVSNAQTINCGRVRLSRVRVIGADGNVIDTGYSADLEAGTVTFSNVAGYSQPVTIEHRIEDMAQIADVQINGTMAFTRQISHDYPVGSIVSSALVAGDLRAYVPVLFDQATWAGHVARRCVGLARDRHLQRRAGPDRSDQRRREHRAVGDPVHEHHGVQRHRRTRRPHRHGQYRDRRGAHQPRNRPALLHPACHWVGRRMGGRQRPAVQHRRRLVPRVGGSHHPAGAGNGSQRQLHAPHPWRRGSPVIASRGLAHD